MEMKEMMQIAFGAFLLVNVLVGLWAGRKVKTMRDYVLANQSMGLGVLTISFLATFIGLTMIGFDTMYKSGVGMLWQAFGRTVSLFFLLGVILLPKLKYFKNCYTLGDVIQRLYGNRASWLTSFLSVFSAFTVVVMQIVYIGVFAEYVGLHSKAMMVVIGSVIVLYSALGGIRTITSTDVLQMVFLVVGMTLIAQTLLAEVGGVQHVFSMDEKKPTSCVFGTMKNLQIVLLILFSFLFFLYIF